MLQFTA